MFGQFRSKTLCLCVLLLFFVGLLFMKIRILHYYDRYIQKRNKIKIKTKEDKKKNGFEL